MAGEVEVEADGLAALSRLRADPPDALILDLMLPDMDGFEVLRNLRADAPTRDLPVLMLTAKGPERRPRSGRTAGCDPVHDQAFRQR